uniref:Uncharacterized protein n=1 Tax=Picea sitchensis TaxID=3332 RepID=D5A939_PICSI|nr:unknown [Picea sitchensis]
MGSEISESGWTAYLDQSLDSWRHDNATSQFDTEQLQNKNSQYTENAERYPTYDYPASSITGSEEEDSSMASDASSGPQKLPLPLHVLDMEFEHDRQAVGSNSLVSKRKRGAYDKHEDLECMASCSSMDVNFKRNNLRKVDKNEDDHELALLLQDTASSAIHRPESGLLEIEVNIEQNQQLEQVESLGDIEVQEVNTRFEVLQSLLPDGTKIGRGKAWGRH